MSKIEMKVFSQFNHEVLRLYRNSAFMLVRCTYGTQISVFDGLYCGWLSFFPKSRVEIPCSALNRIPRMGLFTD